MLLWALAGRSTVLAKDLDAGIVHPISVEAFRAMSLSVRLAAVIWARKRYFVVASSELEE